MQPYMVIIGFIPCMVTKGFIPFMDIYLQALMVTADSQDFSFTTDFIIKDFIIIYKWLYRDVANCY